MNIRTKGSAAEREIIKLLQQVLDTELGKEAPKLQRNTLQTAYGGCDIHGYPRVAIEVKRQEKLNIPAWWKQTLQQASSEQVPILIYRQSFKPWRVRTYGYLPCGKKKVRTVVDISLDAFLLWFRVFVHDRG